MKAYLIAMDNEAQCLIDNLQDIREEKLYGRRVLHGSLDGEKVMLVVSGIGKSNAAAATQLAIQSGATEIVNVGVAGGLDASMNVGDIYEIESAVQYDFDLTQINGTVMGTLDEYNTPYIPLAVDGRFPAKTIGSGDRFNDSEADNDLLVQALACQVRDMECAAVAHVCERAGVTCKAFKCISDVRGNGSAPGQYVDNLRKCLEKLTRLFANGQF